MSATAFKAEQEAAQRRIAAQGEASGIPRGALDFRDSGELSLNSVFAAVWRRRLPVLAWMLVTLGLAAVVILNLLPRFRADALLALDTRQIQFSEVSAVVSGPGNAMDASFVRSEVAILSSNESARRVVSDLGLYRRPEFQPLPPRFARAASAFAGWTEELGGPFAAAARPLRDLAASFMRPPPDAEEQFAAAVAAYGRALSVSNDGRSYIISLGFETTNPELAARIVNRHAELYIEAQRQAKDQALASATRWLDREVSQLAGRLEAAETAVQGYREEFRLFSPRGTPMSQQQLAEVGTQLAVARADLAQREARLRQVRAPGGASSMTEVITSEAVGRLRDQEVLIRRRLNELLGQVGDRHPSVAPVRAQLRDVQNMIEDERQKVARSLASEVAVARSRVDELQRTLGQTEGRAATTERDEAGARALEREASAIRALYESLLSRQKQVATQVGIQQPDAQLVSPADVPRGRSYPNTPLFFAVALLLSGVSGTGIAVVLDRRNSVIRNLDELEEASGLRRVASLPRLPGRLRARKLALAEEVSARPKSRAAEAIRTLRNVLAVPGSGLPRSLAVTSALPGDGKTSVALALGRSLAGSGLRVLLIEADLRRGRLAGAAGGIGLGDVLEKRWALAQAVVDDGRSTLRILPAGQAATAPGDLLNGEAFRRLVTAAAAEHDCVLVDTPPLSAVSDALVVARAVETTLLVVRADSTPRDGVAAAVKELLHADLPIAGVVLNATDPVLVGGRSRRGRRRVHAYLET